MHRDPDLDALPAQTPAAIRRLLRRCLARERSKRLHDIADARIELEEAIANPVVETAPAGQIAVTAPASKLPWIALAVLVPLAAVLAWWAGSGETPAQPEAMRQFELRPEDEVTTAEVSRTRDIIWITNEDSGVIPETSALAPETDRIHFVLGRTHFSAGRRVDAALGIAHGHGATLQWLAHSAG